MKALEIQIQDIGTNMENILNQHVQLKLVPLLELTNVSTDIKTTLHDWDNFKYCLSLVATNIDEACVEFTPPCEGSSSHPLWIFIPSIFVIFLEIYISLFSLGQRKFSGGPENYEATTI